MKQGSKPDIQDIFAKYGNNIKYEINCVKIGKIVALNGNGSYNVELVDVLRYGEITLKPTLLLNVRKIKQGNKGKSLAIEYIVGEYVALCFNDVSYKTWQDGSAYNIEQKANKNRHELSDAFIIGRVSRGEDVSEKMELSLFLNNAIDHLISALQNIRALQALDSVSGNVIFTNISTLDNNITQLQNDKANISKLFE